MTNRSQKKEKKIDFATSLDLKAITQKPRRPQDLKPQLQESEVMQTVEVYTFSIKMRATSKNYFIWRIVAPVGIIVLNARKN